MTRRHIQPKRWTIQWSQNIRDLVGQLHRFERLTYDSLSTVATQLVQQVDSVTGLNLGSGSRVFVDRLNQYLRFRTIRGDDGVSVSENADGLHIDVVSTITGANVGSGADVFRDKTGGDTLNFRGINGINGISTVVNGDNVDVDGSALQLTFQGLDGVDLDEDAGVVTGRSSRDPVSIAVDDLDDGTTGLETADLVYVTPNDPETNWFGIAAPTANQTHRKTIKNVHAANVLVLRHDEAATAPDGFAAPGSESYRVPPGCAVEIDHGANSLWDVIQVIAEEVVTVGGLFPVRNPLFKTDNNDDFYSGDTVDGHQRLVWVDSFRTWLRVGWRDVDNASENLCSQRLSALQGASPSVFAGGAWDDLIDITINPQRGPLFVVAIPRAGATRVVVATTSTLEGVFFYGRYTDDCGATWDTLISNSVSAVSSRVSSILHTGTNLVFGWDTSEIEYSANDGVTSWTVATPPNAFERRLGVTDGSGTVLFFREGLGTEIAVSADHGQTWTEENFPDDIEVLGVAYVSGRFVVIGQDASEGILRTSSADGVTWDPVTTPLFTGPSSAISATLELRENHEDVSCMIAVGDTLVAIVVVNESLSTQGTELYYSTSLGKHWTPTGTYHVAYGAEEDVQVHLVAGENQFAINDRNGVAWLSLIDAQRVLLPPPTTDAEATALTPTAVGGVPSPGVVDDEFALPDHEHDIGVKGADIASASTINLDTSTGDYGHITGTTTITAVTLAEGLRRERIFDDALTIEHSANLLLESGQDETTVSGELWLFRGEGSGVVRAWRLGNPHRGDGITIGLLHGGDTGTPADNEFILTASELLVSATSLDQGNVGLAVLSRMARGGAVPIRRASNPLENMELRVGPATNNVTYLSFPILDRFSTTVAGVLSNMQYATDHYLQLEAQTCRHVHIDPTGRHMLLVQGGAIKQYYLPEAHDQRSGYLVHQEVVSGLDATPRAAIWGVGGLYVIWIGSVGNTLRVFDCGAAYAMSGGADSGETLATGLTNARGLARSNDGLSIFVSTTTSNTIAKFTGSTADDLTTFSGTPAESVTTTSEIANVTATFQIALSPDEERLYIKAFNGTEQLVVAADLAAPLTLTGMTESSRTPDFDALAVTLNGAHVSPDGQYLYVINDTDSRVHRMNIHALTEGVTYRVGFLPDDRAPGYALTFIDDIMYGSTLETSIDLAALLPPNCTAAARLVAAFGSGGEGDTDDFDEHDSAVWQYAQLTMNGGELVAVETQNTRTGTPEWEYHAIRKTGSSMVLSVDTGLLGVLLDTEGTGVWSGPWLGGVVRLYVEAVFPRNEMPAP